jgi:hypothetical protein
MMQKKSLLLTVVLAFTLLTPEPDTKAAERAWEYTLTPYIWTVSLDGDIGAGGRTTSVDADFSDLISYVDKAFMLAFIAHSDRWSAGGNFFTVELEDAIDLRRSVIDAEVDQTIIDAFGAYRPGNWQRLRVLFGLRYYDMETDITFSSPVFGFRVTDDETWVDPVVGLLYRRPLAKKWTVDLEGDIGGFGVGSDFAWNFVFGFNYHFNKTISAVMGGRVLDVDFEESGFTYDATMYGLNLGLGFTF